MAQGLKSNLVRSFTRLSDKYLQDSTKPREFSKLLFAICLFHAVIQDRRKFGPLGWNIRYEFTDGDLSVCQTQIKMLLDEYAEIPYEVIRVLSGEVNYGGRVTDDKDRRLLNTLLLTFINDEAATSDAYSFSESGTYVSPSCATVAEMLEHIRALPQAPAPEVFGLHENADITCDQNETYAMFSTVLALQPRVAGGKGASREEQIESAAKEILAKCPKPFDIEKVQLEYPTAYEESMNTVLAQECIRYNDLLTVVIRTLQESLKALKGLVVMSPELEAITDCIFDNKVPEAWANVAYPSLKPLSSWVVDLIERVRFIENWIANGVPPVFWISGFFFPQARAAPPPLVPKTRRGWLASTHAETTPPERILITSPPRRFAPQAFLTGTLQNYARKNRFPIDTVSFDFVIRDDLQPETAAAPETGCYIHGLYLEVRVGGFLHAVACFCCDIGGGSH